MADIRQGDNADVMRAMLDAGERFTLAYLDPPFFTGRDFETTDGQLAYSDKWSSFDDYLDALLERMRLAFELLEPWGCLVVHVDPTVSHYVKIRGDERFGRKNFASEIIWRYRRWPSKFANFQRMHDVLLRWTTGRTEPRFNQLYEPLSVSTVETWGNRSQHARFDAMGKRRVSVATPDESPGAALSDVWEISTISSGRAATSERTGYPTQKPEALLQRLILATTNEGDRVLSPYMGSGTELAVCHRLGRRCTGIDASEVAVRVARERLVPLEAQRGLFDVRIGETA